jgi:Dyp-type peroxidase family
MSTSPEPSDIQAIVASGFGHLPHATYFFLQIVDRKLAQGWLARVIQFVETSTRRPRDAAKPSASIQIAVTAPGLAALGIGDAPLTTFPREFINGMAHGERSKVLGDSGESAPEHWQIGGPKNPEVHLLLMLYATSRERIAEVMRTHYADAAANGLKEVFRQDSHRAGSFEPFGFRDGIAQPKIEGLSPTRKMDEAALKTGEFVLGYENEYGQQPPMPTVPSELDPGNLLTKSPGGKAFGRNGTFLVFRKLSQDVAGFWKFVEDHSRRPDGSVDEYQKELLAAKFVGRWRSGAPLTLAPEKDDPDLGADAKRNNDFLYMPTDAAGLGCPIGSHIRRTNPRDTQQPNPARSLVITNRHRLLRRGRAYQHGNETGVLFMCLNADLQRQFEFVQQTWVNSEKFNGLYDNKDPLVGNQNDTATGTGSMTIQRCPFRHRVQGIPRFVQVRGGGYFFLPSISALKFLSLLG